MKTLNKIPTSKLERTTELVKTGVKIGGNYLKYYGKKVLDSSTTRDSLNEDNAKDIYDGLKNLKGSALKMAQMLSMEKNLLPRAYVERFSLSQFSVPPLSAPLVRKTIKNYLGKYPEELFETFSPNAINAASIGQVHKATKEGKTLAVKVQYPGVADSISSDLAMVKPIAIKMFNLQGKDSDKYFKEVENKLIEETNYIHELEQSVKITKACNIIPNLIFPNYYSGWSSERVLTMDWMKGIHLSEFIKLNKTQEQCNQIGQTLWNFYMFQIHGLREVHADPHPGNFMINNENQLIAIDFGCIKKIPEDFYIPYFELAIPENINNPEFFEKKMYELEILMPQDSEKEKAFFIDLFNEMLNLFTQPFHGDEFDFANETFWKGITDIGERYSNDQELRKMNGNRGSKHFLYINRTFFGLYHLLYDLKAQIDTKAYKKFLDKI